MIWHSPAGINDSHTQKSVTLVAARQRRQNDEAKHRRLFAFIGAQSNLALIKQKAASPSCLTSKGTTQEKVSGLLFFSA
jgi:folate-dependent tRNA-U54 methylase TrmFO/GidA